MFICKFRSVCVYAKNMNLTFNGRPSRLGMVFDRTGKNRNGLLLRDLLEEKYRKEYQIYVTYDGMYM